MFIHSKYKGKYFLFSYYFKQQNNHLKNEKQIEQIHFNIIESNVNKDNLFIFYVDFWTN